MEQTQKDNIIKKLIDTHTTVSTMESCTSGMIASTITDTEGASAIFPGGYVTYLNETKIFIGVEEEIIRKYVPKRWREPCRKKCIQTLPLE